MAHLMICFLLVDSDITIERIANDVLSLSRIQLQILSIQPIEFELVSEVQRIMAIFRNELKMWVNQIQK